MCQQTLRSTSKIAGPPWCALNHKEHWGPKCTVYQIAYKILSKTKGTWRQPKDNKKQWWLAKGSQFKGSLWETTKSAQDHKWVAGPNVDSFTKQRTTRKYSISPESHHIHDWFYNINTHNTQHRMPRCQAGTTGDLCTRQSKQNHHGDNRSRTQHLVHIHPVQIQFS